MGRNRNKRQFNNNNNNKEPIRQGILHLDKWYAYKEYRELEDEYMSDDDRNDLLNESNNESNYDDSSSSNSNLSDFDEDAWQRETLGTGQNASSRPVTRNGNNDH